MLPRYRRTSLRAIGKATERKLPQRRLAYAEVARRAKGHCELCHHAQDPLDPHHVFGRGHLPGIPAQYCETPELILGICHDCHEAITGQLGSGIDHILDLEAKHLALERFERRWDVHGWTTPTDDPADELRALVRYLEEQGVA